MDLLCGVDKTNNHQDPIEICMPRVKNIEFPPNVV